MKKTTLLLLIVLVILCVCSVRTNGWMETAGMLVSTSLNLLVLFVTYNFLRSERLSAKAGGKMNYGMAALKLTGLSVVVCLVVALLHHLLADTSFLLALAQAGIGCLVALLVGVIWANWTKTNPRK